MSEDEFQRQTDENAKCKSSLKGASPDKGDDAFVKQVTEDADVRCKTEGTKKIRFAPVGPEEIRENENANNLPPQYDLETAFDEMGGFGKFQWLTTIMMCLARNGGNYMINGFAYLTLEQMY